MNDFKTTDLFYHGDNSEISSYVLYTYINGIHHNTSNRLLRFDDLQKTKDYIGSDLVKIDLHFQVYSVQFFYTDFNNNKFLYKGCYPYYSCISDLVESVCDLFDLFYRDLRRFKLHVVT